MAGRWGGKGSRKLVVQRPSEQACSVPPPSSPRPSPFAAQAASSQGGDAASEVPEAPSRWKISVVFVVQLACCLGILRHWVSIPCCTTAACFRKAIQQDAALSRGSCLHACCMPWGHDAIDCMLMPLMPLPVEDCSQLDQAGRKYGPALGLLLRWIRPDLRVDSNSSHPGSLHVS